MGTPKKLTKRETWTFDRWFRRQHGPRPGGNVSTAELGQRLADATVKLSDARGVYQARRQYEARETSALYAWQIGDSQKRCF